MARNLEQQSFTRQAIQIPAPGIQSERNPNPTALSPPPFLGGWGTPAIKQVRVEVEEKKPEPEVIRVETLSASGFIALVESEYRCSEDLQRRIPFSFFQYYMIQAWWRRTLEIKAEVRGLNEEERAAHDALVALGPIPLTGRIADYFRSFSSRRYSGIGNTTFSFSGSIGVNGYRGFLLCNNTVRVDSTAMWIYSLFPVPGVALSALFRDFVRAVSYGASEYSCFPEIRPVTDFFPGSDSVLETGNILCWRETGLLLDLELTRSLCAMLGMSRVEDISGGIDDQSTDWLVSPRLMYLVASSIDSSDLGVVPFDSLDCFENWHQNIDTYIRVRQTRESTASLKEAPSFWSATTCGISTLQMDHHHGDWMLPYLVMSGFGVEISFGDDGTTNHSPWYGARGHELLVEGPRREDLLNSTSLVLSWRSGQGTYPTFHTEAVRRQDVGKSLSVHYTPD